MSCRCRDCAHAQPLDQQRWPSLSEQSVHGLVACAYGKPWEAYSASFERECKLYRPKPELAPANGMTR